MSPESLQPTKQIQPPVFIIILLFITGLIGSFQIYESSRPVQRSSSEVGDEVLNLLNKDETSTWKTYRNEEYGFEFNYPREWKDIKAETDTFYYFGCPEVPYGGGLSCPMFFNLVPVVDGTKAIFDSYRNLGNYVNPNIEIDEYSKIGGLEYLNLVIKSDYPVDDGYKIICNNNYCGIFGFPILYYWNNQISNQILSTFKFTK